MAQRFYNNFSTTLSAASTAASTSLSLSIEPEMNDGDWCWLTIQAKIGIFTVIEIVKASKENGAISFARGQQSTIASDFPSGAKIENRATAYDYESSLDFNALVSHPII